MITIKDRTIKHENIEKEIQQKLKIKPKQAIYITRHVSKTGEPTLTTHPIGNTEFRFLAADMNFHSENYDWLVITNSKAIYKGNGTINGNGNYGFMISAIDEKHTPSTDIDMFRIKIWDKDNNDTIIYDNQLGDDEDSDPTTEIAGGQIVIHKK